MFPQLVPGTAQSDAPLAKLPRTQMRLVSACSLRESSQADGGEEVDGESRVPGILAREKTFKEALQRPGRQTKLVRRESLAS